MLGYDKTVTLFTPYLLKDDIGNITARKWQKLILKDVSLRSHSELIGSGEAFAKKSVSTLRVAKRDDYVKPYDFQGVGFTLMRGALVIEGEVDDVIEDNDSSNELLKKYEGRAFTLESIKDNSNMPTTAHYRGDDQ